MVQEGQLHCGLNALYVSQLRSGLNALYVSCLPSGWRGAAQIPAPSRVVCARQEMAAVHLQGRANGGGPSVLA